MLTQTRGLAALRKEIHQHDFSHFVGDPTPIAQGGRGVVAGCPKCRKKSAPCQFWTILRMMFCPAILDRLSMVSKRLLRESSQFELPSADSSRSVL